MENKKEFTLEQAMAVGRKLGINWHKVIPEEFRMGLGVEMEHGRANPLTNVTDDDIMKTAKIALAHLLEGKQPSRYYTELRKMEKRLEGAEPKTNLEKALAACEQLKRKSKM